MPNPYTFINFCVENFVDMIVPANTGIPRTAPEGDSMRRNDI